MRISGAEVCGSMVEIDLVMIDQLVMVMVNIDYQMVILTPGIYILTSWLWWLMSQRFKHKKLVWSTGLISHSGTVIKLSLDDHRCL